ncbi:hypothetical protein BD769DRAFT_1664905 [Suillus cothurnatus]|nr:hypothetical protein BD769DRAFT_1664905 [Suillus cothurnatus]
MSPGRSNAMMDVTDDEGEYFDDIVLNAWDISVILACAGSRLRACLIHFQREAEVTPWPSERVKYIRTGLQWELASFVVPFINYAISRSMVPTPSSVVKTILGQFSQNLLQPVPNHTFAADLMSIDPLTENNDPSRMVNKYDREWWISGVSVNLTVPLLWDAVRKSVDDHVRQWPEGCALTIPAPQAELGDSSCLAQLFLMRERLRRIAAEQVAEIEKLLGQARVQAQTIERLGHKRDPSVMHAVALGLPVSLLWRDNLTPSTTPHSIERFNECDSHIAALRRSHSRTPSWHPTASPVLSPRESSSDTTEAFGSWDWTHFGASPGSSHTSGKDRRVGSGSTHTAAPRQVESLSLQTSDGLSSRPGYTTSSSNTFNSTSLSNTPPHPPYRSSPSISSSARANASIRESDAFPSGSLTSVPSVLQAERNNIDASNEPDGRQGIHNGSSSGSSNLSWAALASSRSSPPVASSPDVVGRQGAHRVPSSGSSNLARATLVPPRSSPPVAPSPDVVTCPVLLDSIFGSLTSDVAARPQAVRRTTHSDASWRSMSSARTSGSTSASSSRLFVTDLGDSISHFYAPDEEQYRDTPNTIQDFNPPSPRSTDRYQEVAARARTVIERSRNLVRPISEASASFSREQAVEDSDEAGLLFDRYLVGLGEEDSIDRERWRRVTAHNRYNLAGDNDEDSYPDSVHEIIRGLRNARGLLERGVETARSLSGSPSRHKPPNPPPTRYRCHSRLYASATTVSSNLLVSESAAEHRRTNARTHLRSQLFGSRPNSDEPRDSSDISNLTVTARLRRLIIASQADSSSNTSSRILSSGRTSDLPSRQFALNNS